MEKITETKFFVGDEFIGSLRNLYKKGGKHQKAAEKVQVIQGRTTDHCLDFEEVFQGIQMTNHGENRIPYCRKYDLNGNARLVTVYQKHICIFLYCGDHDDVDKWLEKNKGLNFIVKQSKDSRKTISTVRVSDMKNYNLIHSESNLSSDTLVSQLPEDYQEKLLNGLNNSVTESIKLIESISTDDEILQAIDECKDDAKQWMVIDVLLSLKSGKIDGAKNRIDLFLKESIPIADLTSNQVNEITSSESVISALDIDPILFDHFVKTASFEKWMLYLHPSQRIYVEKDYSGSAKLSGISGSGKTCVVVHRALRLAKKYKDEPVLVITLNPALSSLINKLINSQCGKLRPTNIKVSSIFDLCYEKLLQLEPNKADYYAKKTIQKNPYATSEHIDEIWNEYFLCHNNNDDADVMFDIIQTLNVRGVFSNEYIKQEIDFIRSGFNPNSRSSYLEMKREGRVIPFEKRHRELMLEGLQGWERKMNAVGAVDDMGIVTALSLHIDSLEPEYRCILVDEVQDLGTLEMSIIRKLVKNNENDLFLCGDATQTIYTKHSDMKESGIDFSGNIEHLKQNYRNSREILTTAYAVLKNSLEHIPTCALHLSVLQPEYASFSSPKPLLLKSDSFLEELAYAISYLKEYYIDNNKKSCIALCGYTQSSVEDIAKKLKIISLNQKTDINSNEIFISDLESTKGFEFDVVVIVNCTNSIIPHPILPKEESFRDLSRLYVAMTRAKTELLISYHGQPSIFIEAAKDKFNEDDFSVHADLSLLTESFPVSKNSTLNEQKITGEKLKLKKMGVAFDFDLPPPSLPERKNSEVWECSARPFLKSRDAVGLNRSVQDALLKAVTGKELLQGKQHKQKEWKTVKDFMSSMQSPSTRNQVISPEAWKALNEHLSNG